MGVMRTYLVLVCFKVRHFLVAYSGFLFGILLLVSKIVRKFFCSLICWDDNMSMNVCSTCVAVNTLFKFSPKKVCLRLQYASHSIVK